MATKKQIEAAFLEYVNDQQKVGGSDVRAFAICTLCGFPVYKSVRPMNFEGPETRFFHLGYRIPLCDGPKWREK